ncbi:MAG: 3'(2'),5'-bisphosphate nucleotidase CysQ [Hyphomicrobium sp.]|nr:3'(2'),5'-bisphosphate nucleotidase CysQ [Hyphomicrobium sp.]
MSIARDLAADHALLIEAVEEAGALARRFFETGFKSWEKYPDDPVSEADIAVDKLLRERLLAARPDYGWRSEESTAQKGSGARTWVVDPIDGTRAFVAKKPEFAVSLALMEAGRPVAGAVFNPATDELFEAVRGGGARRNGQVMRASIRTDLSSARLLASQRTFEKNRWIERTPGASFHYMNSIAYRMARVAAGDFEAAISMTEKNDWDVAAAHLLLEEAGACCSAVTGEALSYAVAGARLPSVLASAPGVHDILVGMLKSRA